VDEPPSYERPADAPPIPSWGSRGAVGTSAFLAPTPVDRIDRASIPTFSILIATYQAASSVGEAVASALAQTRPALEVIVADDGSTDDLEGALAPYRDRIRLLRKPNAGAASALNYAARVAQGEFLAILDADDAYHPRRLQALGDLAAARPDLDIITTDAYYEVEGRIVGRVNRATPFVTDDQRSAILRSCFVGGWPAVRRSRILAAGGWEESLRIGYDWDCWLRLILDGAGAGLVDEPLMSYRLHAGSLTSNRTASLHARVLLLERAKDHPSLTRRERRILSASIRWQRSRLIREIEERAANGSSHPPALLLARCRERLARARWSFMH
jgi:glycosyltransferase involved in cell wall biosynthesis